MMVSYTSCCRTSYLVYHKPSKRGSMLPIDDVRMCKSDGRFVARILASHRQASGYGDVDE